jgi:hypothetical protein
MGALQNLTMVSMEASSDTQTPSFAAVLQFSLRHPGPIGNYIGIHNLAADQTRPCIEPVNTSLIPQFHPKH